MLQKERFFEEGDLVSNFLLEKKQKISDIDSVLYHFRHQKTKTLLVALKNKDKNKAFCIGFQTLPYDSTGTPHILEHSVLSGSKRYPLKDVFSEILKGSLTTFINAMTYSDKTLYPFSTENISEYFSFMHIYLDLTLNPLLHEETFMQEGWHYELNSKEDKMTYNGVVYNEMKGAYSSPFCLLYDQILENLFPGSTYSFSSGGLPTEIVKLTYEKFLKFHQMNYHPSKANIAIYGDALLERELEQISTEFLDNFEMASPPSIISIPSILKAPKVIHKYYPVATDSKEKDLSYSALAIGLESSPSIERQIIFYLLSDILVNSDASDIKKIILGEELAKEVGAEYENLYKPIFMIYAIQTNKEKSEKIYEIIQKELNKYSTKGLNKKIVEAQISNIEFSFKEARLKVTKGLNYIIEILARLNYSYEVEDIFQENKILENLKQKINAKDGYLESFITDNLLEANETVFVNLHPSMLLNKENQDSLNQELLKYRMQLQEDEVTKLIERTKDLKQKQEESNTPAQLEILPRLSLSDLEKVHPVNLSRIEEIKDKELLLSIAFTNDIIYLDLGFKINHLSYDELLVLQIFSKIFLEIGTKNKTYQQLSNIVNLYIGSLSYQINFFSNWMEPQNNMPTLWIRMRYLKDNVQKSFDILKEIFSSVLFDNPEQIKKILRQMITEEEEKIHSEGYHIPSIRLRSYLSMAGKFSDTTEGYRFYTALKKLNQDFSSNKESFIDLMKKMKTKIFCKNNFVVHATLEENNCKNLNKELEVFYEELPLLSDINVTLSYPEYKTQEAFITNSNVCYNGVGLQLSKKIPYNGTLDVVKVYLDRDYLYKEIRVKGGAYGNFSTFDKLYSNVTFMSYRDGNVNKTYDIYHSIPSSLQKLDISKKELDRFKITAYSKLNRLENVYQKSIRARNMYLSKFTHETRMQYLDEIMKTDIVKIRAYAEVFEDAFKRPYYSTIGNKNFIEENSNRFHEIYTI